MIAVDALDTEAQLPPPVHRSGRSVTMAEALDLIPDRSRVYVGGLMGPATSIIEAMAAQPDRWTELETAGDYLFEPLATFAHGGAPFRHLSVQPSRALDGMAELGALRMVSGCSSQFASLFAPDGPVAVDVAVVQVSAAGPDGRFSLGVNGGAVPEIVRSAPVVIAEVNPRMPYLRGAVECQRHDFDALVEVEPHELIEAPPAPPGEVSDRIGELVASMVPDGAVIEYGIGAIPDAAVAALSGHRNLGLHSGLLGDAVIDLVEAGVMTGSAKSVDAGLHVASTIIGTMAAVDWAAGRDDVVIVASNYSHGVPVLARLDRFVAINSAVEVAFDGSVNAEMAGGRVVSGPGGQPDFAAGASLSVGGVGVVALPATARRGTSSRIVPAIEPPQPVTVPHYLADVIVTEFGIAELRGADHRLREQRLRSIAAPGLLDEQS